MANDKFSGSCAVNFGDFAALPTDDNEARNYCIQVIGGEVWNQVSGVRQVMCRFQDAVHDDAVVSWHFAS